MSEYLCRNLRLSIWREDETKQLQLRLTNDLTLQDVEIWYEIGESTPASRRYHVGEAMVIAMRRVVSAAIDAKLISDSPGEHMSLKSGTTGPPNPSITFSTDGDS